MRDCTLFSSLFIPSFLFYRFTFQSAYFLSFLSEIFLLVFLFYFKLFSLIHLFHILFIFKNLNAIMCSAGKHILFLQVFLTLRFLFPHLLHQETLYSFEPQFLQFPGDASGIQWNNLWFFWKTF